ncbi:MAG: cysteine desulfurase [Clostridia bacterium]|nr:cysteine desulfurase [Clostridia bacterium]
MIYLDNSATTRAFSSVAQVVSDSMQEQYYNISSPYSKALETEKALISATKIIALSLNADPKEIIFTSGGTESDNTAILSAPAGSEVIVSAVEHHAILSCARPLEKKGCKMIICPVTPLGTVDPAALKNLVNENTYLVSIMHVNNETGAINPIAELVRAVKEKNPKTLFHSDGVQAFMHVCTDVKKLGVDMYSVSAHKVHGPKGVGALFIKNKTPFTPFIYGGGQQNDLRSGTVNVPGICGFAKAIEEISSSNSFAQKLAKIKSAYTEKLLAIPDSKLICPNSAPNILSIAFLGVKASSLQNALEQEVIIGKGSACTSRSSKVSHVLEAMSLPLNVAEATVRISFGAFNTLEEVNDACESIEQKIAYLRKYKRK